LARPFADGSIVADEGCVHSAVAVHVRARLQDHGGFFVSGQQALDGGTLLVISAALLFDIAIPIRGSQLHGCEEKVTHELGIECHGEWVPGLCPYKA
jgi:hypothetical protein